MAVEKNPDKMAKMALEADGNVVGDSFIIRPEKNLTAKLGVIFGVIEIYNINDTFLDGFLSALNDLKTEYFLPPFNLEHGVEKRFEEAIGRANRRIFSAVNQSVEEIDLRNVSAAIGLLHNDKVYLSSAGRVKGLFFRRKKNSEILIIDILNSNGEARFRPEPEKLFANILSGELRKRDGLILINEEYLAVFSQKELGETVLDNGAAEAVGIIDSALREKITRKNYYAVIIAPAGDDETPASVPKAALEESQSNATVSTRPFRDNPKAMPGILVQGKNAAEIARPQARRNIATQQSLDQLLVTQVRTEKYLAPSLLPQWQKILFVSWTAGKKSLIFLARQAKKSGSAAFQIFTNVSNKRAAMPKANQALAEAEKPAEEPPENQGSDDIIMPPAILIEEIQAQRDMPSSKLSDRVNHFLNSQIEKFLALKRGQQIILAIGLILIFLFSQSVVMIGRASDNSQNGSSANNSVAQQIATQLDNAEAQNIFNDEAGAVQSIRKARELLAQIPGTRLNKSLISDLQEKIDAAAGALQKIIRLDDPKAIADFSSNQTAANLAGLAKTGTIFWAFDNLSKSLYRLDPATGNATLATTSLPQIQKITAIDDKNLILLAEGKIYYKYDIAKRTTAKTKPSKDYFQIKLPASVSPLIDPSLASSTIAMSVTSEAYLFFLDGVNGRIVALDKNGVLKRQFYSDKFKGAAAFAADAKNKKLFVFNAGKVYQIDLDF